jgi:adenylate cyclase
MNFPTDGDDRRPSIASNTTVSSTGSKSSTGRGFHKKLQGFFGEEYVGLQEASRQNSETSSMQGQLPAFAPGAGAARNRNNSVNDSSLRSGPPSPSSSRPRTPAQGPSNEVTPWEFQDTQV